MPIEKDEIQCCRRCFPDVVLNSVFESEAFVNMHAEIFNWVCNSQWDIAECCSGWLWVSRFWETFDNVKDGSEVFGGLCIDRGSEHIGPVSSAYSARLLFTTSGTSEVKMLKRIDPRTALWYSRWYSNGAWAAAVDFHCKGSPSKITSQDGDDRLWKMMVDEFV